MNTNIQQFGSPADLSTAAKSRGATAEAQDSFGLQLATLLEDLEHDELAAEASEFEWVRIPVRKDHAAYLRGAEPTEPPQQRLAREKAPKSYVTAQDQVVLGFLGKWFATAEIISWLFTTEQKVSVRKVKDSSAPKGYRVEREVSKTGGDRRLIEPRSAYRRLNELEKNGLVFSERFATGTIWSITEQGLATISRLLPGYDAVKWEKVAHTGLANSALIPDRLMIAAVAAGLLSENDFLRKRLPRKNPHPVQKIITDRQIDHWKALKINELIAEAPGTTRRERAESAESLTAWRGRKMDERLALMKDGVLEASELMSEDPALWVSGFYNPAAQKTAIQRTWDLVLEDEGIRTASKRASVAVEVEREPKTVEAYVTWIHTFWQELTREGYPIRQVYVFTNSKEVENRLEKADRLVAWSRAGVENASSYEAKYAAEQRGLIAQRALRIVRVARPDGSLYDPAKRF